MNKILAFLGICSGAFLFVLDYSIANVAIPYIAGDLAVSNDQGTYVITAFAVGNAIFLPMTGWLVKRIGSTKLFALSVACFTLLSFLCGVSTSILELVLFRFLQGAVAGPMIPLGQTFIVRMFSGHMQNFATSLFAMVVLVAPVLGPIIGGFICINYHWGWIFFINVPIGIASTMIIALQFKSYETPTQRWPLDYIGFILLAVGITALQILLDKGQQWNWLTDPRIQVLSICAFLGLLYLVIRCLTTDHPFINLHLFKKWTFTMACLILSLGYSLYFGMIVLIPLWLQTYMGYDALWAGLAVAPIGFLPILFGASVARLMKVFGRTALLLVTFLFFALSCYYVTFFTPQVNFFHIAFSRLLLGGGVLFFVTPIFSLATMELNEEELPMGTGIFHFLRALSGGIGTSVYTTIWYRRMDHQHLNFAEMMTPYSSPTGEYLDTLKDIGLTGEKALAAANTMVDKQASVFAICETFALMTLVSLVLLFLSFLARPRRSSCS